MQAAVPSAAGQDFTITNAALYAKSRRIAINMHFSISLNGVKGSYYSESKGRLMRTG